MFTSSLLFCSCLVAFWSTGSVSTNSQVDPTAAYANLLALLTGNTELTSPARVPYLRRLPHQGKNVKLHFLQKKFFQMVGRVCETFYLHKICDTFQNVFRLYTLAARPYYSANPFVGYRPTYYMTPQPVGPQLFDQGFHYADESKFQYRSGADPRFFGLKATALNALVGSLVNQLRGPPGTENSSSLLAASIWKKLKSIRFSLS